MANRDTSGSKVKIGTSQPKIVPIPSRLCIRVVIPTLNEETTVSAALESLWGQEPPFEIVAVDGGSTDDTVNVLQEHGIPVIHTAPCRGAQLQAGAQRPETGEPPGALLFLHADARLPRGALRAVRGILSDPRVVGGKFPMRFDADHPLLRLAGVFSRWKHPWFSYGDQGFFVRQETFRDMGGFDPIPLFEDVVFYRRLRRRGRLGVAPRALVTSGRKYTKDGVARGFLRNMYLRILFSLGVSPEKLAARYYGS